MFCDETSINARITCNMTIYGNFFEIYYLIYFEILKKITSHLYDAMFMYYKLMKASIKE